MTRLGEMLRLWREANRYGVRETAKMIGISHATLSRIERGEGMDAQTFYKVIVWVGAA